MSFFYSKKSFLILTALSVSCSHVQQNHRAPAALSTAGLGDANLQKKLDGVFQTGSSIENLSSKGAAESPGTSVQTLSGKEVEGSVFEWKSSSSKDSATSRVSRLVIGKIVRPLKRDEGGNYYTYASGSHSGSASTTLSQLHLGSSGELVSFTKCETPKGSSPLHCFEATEDSCWTFFKPKTLAETPSKQTDWKTQACGLRPVMEVTVNEIFDDADEWGEEALKKDSVLKGVGNNRVLFNEDLIEAFSNHAIEKSADEHTALLNNLKKLHCDVVEVRSSEEDVISAYMKLFQPVAMECQRLQKIFPTFGQAQNSAVISEGRKSRTAASHSAAKAKKKKKATNKKTRWIWQK